MKLSDLAKSTRPIFCRFEYIDDTHAGVIAKEPVWQEDNYNPGKEMLVIPLTCGGVRYELRARGQMIEAIVAAVSDAKLEDLQPGGYLSVTFTEFRGKAKIYRAAYEPPEDSCGCGDARGPMIYLWRINHPTRTGGKRNQKIFDTAVRAAKAAQTEWTRIWWNPEVAHYTHQTSLADLPEPSWPDLTFEEILTIAFEGLVIDGLDHEVLRELRTGSRDKE